MNGETPLLEQDREPDLRDPDEIPIRDRRVFTQPYDLVVESLIDQINAGTIFLGPISERPSFQRRYVWTNILASRLIESMLLNVPIPPCYLSQNDEYELDVIDGQQRLFSIYRFLDNQFPLTGLIRRMVEESFLPNTVRSLKVNKCPDLLDYAWTHAGIFIRPPRKPVLYFRP